MGSCWGCEVVSKHSYMVCTGFYEGCASLRGAVWHSGGSVWARRGAVMLLGGPYELSGGLYWILLGLCNS